MYHPIATYRLQFHKQFNFTQFKSCISYLKQLGVATIYAAPIFEALPGSTHGYDATNANFINPEIGSLQQLKQLSSQLQNAGIGWLQDVVPNHMAYSTKNPWVLDMLEKGSQSVFAEYFDVTWSDVVLEGRIMAPFLGNDLHTTINNKEVFLVYEQQRFFFKYFSHLFPLHPRSYFTLLASEAAPMAVQQLLLQVENLKSIEDKAAYAQRWHEVLLQFSALMQTERVKQYIENLLEKFNNDPALLAQLAAQQAYELCNWQQSDHRINYRRFFTVNGLICLNIQNTDVFTAHHELMITLVKTGIFQGLRIDHVDGLYNPAGYLQQLRKATGPNTYIVVEKILEQGEALPNNWPVQGTTGYDFLALVNNLLTLPQAQEAFTHFYHKLATLHQPVEEQIAEKKAYILYHHMAGELENLFNLFMLLLHPEDYAHMRTEDVKTAIAQMLIYCPVYRYYGNTLPLQQPEAKALRQTLSKARVHRPDLGAAIQLLQTILLERPACATPNEREKTLRFYQRCMQLSGPLMAKGVEDTLMYTYNAFVAHNEVGDAPHAFGLTVSQFHAAMKDRQSLWPLTMNATATHDTKRGEDVRARLNVLSECAAEWMEKIAEWQQLNAHLKKEDAPLANDEYFIYQTIVGTFPMQGYDETYLQRLQSYLEKALREAKQHSNWATPNLSYEMGVKHFAEQLLQPGTAFINSLQKFLKGIVDFGIVNSLVQTILKFTCPGVPDVYQGCETWDFSFVDPDNRRPVNYELLNQSLQTVLQTETQPHFYKQLWQTRHNAQIKLWLTHKLFLLRKQEAAILQEGSYVPLRVNGSCKNNVLAFGRKHKNNWLVVAVPLHLKKLCEDQNTDLENINWKDTKIQLPENTLGWKLLLPSAAISFLAEAPVTELFANLPFALLLGETPPNPRGAGILLHISSLPSAFGIGDLGPAAYAFSRFLSRSYQKYWQVLPLNPTEAGQSHSPYSAISAFAGNPLLISPEVLVEENLLHPQDLKEFEQLPNQTVDFEKASEIKAKLLSRAFSNFKQQSSTELQQEFKSFCNQQQEWLNDFALYQLLKDLYEGKPWYQWPEAYKHRHAPSLQQLSQAQAAAIEKIKWIQCIFSRQWRSLKDFCSSLQVQLVGDLPIYVSYDSADVWANRSIFKLNADGDRTAVAGVPPDAFSATGQLWGMPVYNWKVLQQQRYKWWVLRLKNNIENFDWVRLDHFRGFVQYWEVPAKDENAINGTWNNGPGMAFFKAVKEQLGALPFVAEDLGDINEDVIAVRDALNLPGMKVLQFAFGENMPESPHIPHNYTPNFFAYTGTHDNNTTRGWYEGELNAAAKKKVQQYLSLSSIDQDITAQLCRHVYASVAQVAILPMQDVLELNASARMNLPASTENNWAWRLLPQQITTNVAAKLRSWVVQYNRF